MSEYVGRQPVVGCSRCGRRRQLGARNVTDLCRDCKDVIRRYDAPLTENDTNVQWVRTGLVWRQRQVPRRIGRRPPAACGTDGGYFRHIRGTIDQPKTEPCDACREAHAAAERRRNRQWEEVA